MTPDQLRRAHEAFHRGEISHARRLVAQVLLADPVNEQAWLLMARLVYNREQVIDCLEHALKINPTNHVTISALGMMKRGKPNHVRPIPSSTLDVPGHPRAVVSEKPFAVIKKAGPEPVYLSLPGQAVQTIPPPRQKVNAALISGVFIVLIVILIAFIGPHLAPHDPLEENPILHVGEKFISPPFNAFQVPGYLLGSDRFGRDLLSRILYAVRPTLIMVSLVAVVRLILGTLIGLGAGWFNGRLGYFLDGLISAALAIPILLVALGAITIVGAETGLLAFIIGLSINGWGESARLVREQTLLIKGQLFIESARSLGASTFQILTRHILRQIMPMVWMLFAFEISGTLMVTASLGFLGYYIGGDVWIVVADFVSQRTSGAPELGQMLATSWVNLLQSWPLVLTGLVIFITVLGFNLLGEGLRSRLTPVFIDRNNPLAVLGHRFSLWFEESISYPASSWLKANRLRPALVILVVLALAASVHIYRAEFASRFNPSQVALTVPGGQIWSSEKVDPYGTSYTNIIGPSIANRLWLINNPAGFSGSPVISADGTIYAAGLDSKLIAVNPDGSHRWVVSAPEVPLGPLALAANNVIYVTDSKGGLSAFNSDGSFLWTYSTDVIGKPNHGAIVAPDGPIYYLLEDQLGDTLIALTPGGELLWSVNPGTRIADTTLRLSPDGQEIFVKDKVVNSLDGSRVDLTLPTESNIFLAKQAHLFVGADGKTYLLAGHVVIQWMQTSQGFNIVRSANWNYRGEGFSQNSGLPQEAGVTPAGNIWLFYSGLFGGTSVYWLEPNDNILGSFKSPYSKYTRLVAFDIKGTAYTCGMGYSSTYGPAIMCEAYHLNASIPDWSYTFDENTRDIVGAAMAPGRLYVITSQGDLVAIGDSSNLPSTPASTP